MDMGTNTAGRFQNVVFSLRHTGELWTHFPGNISKPFATNVVYADGSEDFAIYVTAGGKFYCESNAGLCPPRDAGFPASFVEVASANAEGLVFRLATGALYYRGTSGEWTTDEDARAVGRLGGSLYRLRSDGTVERDGEEFARAETLLVTNDAVLADGAEIARREDPDTPGNVRRMSAPKREPAKDGSAAIRVERQPFFRSPVLFTKEIDVAVDESGCADGELPSARGCVRICQGPLSNDGRRCLEAMPAHAELVDGRFAVCSFGFVAADDDTCVCDKVLSMDGQACKTGCGEHEEPAGGQCMCMSGYALDENTNSCVEIGGPACERVVIEGAQTKCLQTSVCPAGLKLSPDGYTCVSDCERWAEDASTGELRCVDECPGWWYSEDGGFCKEEKWRKSTAIAVPVALVVVVLAVILTIVLVRRKRSVAGKDSEVSAGEPEVAKDAGNEQKMSPMRAAAVVQ